MVVGQKRISGGLQQLTIMLRNGKTIEVKSDSVAFCVKEFYKSEQVSQPVVDSFKPNDVDSNGLLNTIPLAYNRAIQYYQRTVNSVKGMAHQDLDQLYKFYIKNNTTVSLEELASTAFKTKRPNSLQRHATFLHLVSDNIHFIPSMDVRGSDIWLLRESEECDKITGIIKSIRSRDQSYTEFLGRMKSLVTFYHTHADPVLGTFSQTALKMLPTLTQKLADSDKVYIDFIVDWIRSSKVIVDSPHEVFVPTILKGLKCYDDLFFDKRLAAQFLKEIGMFKPWDNIGLIENSFVADEFLWSEKARQNEAKMTAYTSAFLSGKGFNQHDSYERIRHDFGDLPVYTIDDPSAKEIDDGISIEYGAGDNSAWLHVHIADPTTYISPTHELSQLMQRKTQTLYLPERHIPMLPEELSSKKFSLGSTAHTNKNGSQYALTFSTKLDKNGNLMDYKIRPSLVRNVHKIYYDDLDQLLQPLSTPYNDPLVNLSRSFSHPFQEAFSSKDTRKQGTTIQESAHKDLINLFHMAKKHAAKRIENGAILFSKPSPMLEIEPNPLELPNVQFDSPSYATHLPAVRVKLDKSAYSPARQMVAETMIMGGRIASLFAKENDVTLPFRAQQWNPNATTADLKLREEMLSSRDPSTGMLNMIDMVKYLSILPPTVVTTKPGLPHVVMGIQDGYTRATSPLRRYFDFVVHWQIKSRLMGDSKLPFSKEDINALASTITTKEKQLSLLQQKSTQFWVVSLLDRLRVDGFTDKMEWNCIVNMPARVALTELGGTMDVTTGTLLELGVRGRIEKLNRNLEIGEIVKVRITSLDPTQGRINMELV